MEFKGYRVTKKLSNAMLIQIISYMGYMNESRPILKLLSFSGYLMASTC